MRTECLEPLLERWEEAIDEGVELPAEELCPDDPNLAGRLAGHIETLRWMRRALLDLGAPSGPVRRWRGWELS
ncbi:MAG: hypothetical protein ACRC33_00355 [Gemmataceae bacterium]